MASALDTIAHLVLPNFLKIKGSSAIMSAMERRDTMMFASVWEQAGIPHKPEVAAKDRGDWRFGLMSLPTPTENGQAYICAFVSKKADPAFTRYFTLDYDYVLSTKSARTQLWEREGSKMVKLVAGSAVTGDFQTDANAFIDLIMTVLDPKPVVDPNRNYR